MLLGLDGLRAVAFLLVFLFHTDYLSLGIGWVGVQLFFVLSGFLITGILLDMKSRFATRDYFVKFYGRRFLRIFPLYYFYLLAVLALSFWLEGTGFAIQKMILYRAQLPYALAFIYDFFFAANQNLSSLLSHFWSLSVEEQFYIFWPLLIFLVPEKHLKKLFLAAIFAGPLFRLGFFLASKSPAFSSVLDNLPYGIYSLPFMHVDAFGFGAYLARNKIPEAKKQFVFLIVAVPIIGFVTQYLSTGSSGGLNSLGYPFLMENGYQSVWGYSLLNYLFMVTLSVVVYDGLFTKFLEWKPVAYLGKISYGLYVYHLGLIWFFHRLLENKVPGSPPIQHFLIVVLEFAFTTLIASLSYYLFEKPILSLKDKFFSVRN